MSNHMHKIGEKYSTDKISSHKYHLIYDFFFQSLYNQSGSLLEIGIQKGESLRMWHELFKNMNIYGVDMDNYSISDIQKQGDNLDRLTLLSNIKQGENIDHLDKVDIPELRIVIDDASHYPPHQIETFNNLFPRLENGGLYIIEDIETSYWTAGRKLYGNSMNYGVGSNGSTVEIFKGVVEGINNKNSKIYREQFIPQVIQEYIMSVVFALNCIIVIKK